MRGSRSISASIMRVAFCGRADELETRDQVHLEEVVALDLELVPWRIRKYDVEATASAPQKTSGNSSGQWKKLLFRRRSVRLAVRRRPPRACHSSVIRPRAPGRSKALSGPAVVDRRRRCARLRAAHAAASRSGFDVLKAQLHALDCRACAFGRRLRDPRSIRFPSSVAPLRRAALPELRHRSRRQGCFRV